MSYTPTRWTDGVTPVNAENLNKMEEGIQQNAADIEKINAAYGTVKTVNDTYPDENGNVKINIPEYEAVSVDEVVDAVLVKLPTWEGGSY